jgi:hypothetical protein
MHGGQDPGDRVIEARKRRLLALTVITGSPHHPITFPSTRFLQRIDASPLLCNMALNPSGCIQWLVSVAVLPSRGRYGLLCDKPW